MGAAADHRLHAAQRVSIVAAGFARHDEPVASKGARLIDVYALSPGIALVQLAGFVDRLLVPSGARVTPGELQPEVLRQWPWGSGGHSGASPHHQDG
jgi:hypothetical protein